MVVAPVTVMMVVVMAPVAVMPVVVMVVAMSMSPTASRRSRRNQAATNRQSQSRGHDKQDAFHDLHPFPGGYSLRQPRQLAAL